MLALLTRLGFRPYPDPPPRIAPVRSGRCFSLATGPRDTAQSADTLAMYASALALMTVVVAARPLPQGGEAIINER